MTNEAAKQLEKWVSGSDETLATFRFRVKEALAEERRLTVELIGGRIRAEANTFVGEIDLETVRSILDEVSGEQREPPGEPR